MFFRWCPPQRTISPWCGHAIPDNAEGPARRPCSWCRTRRGAPGMSGRVLAKAQRSSTLGGLTLDTRPICPPRQEFPVQCEAFSPNRSRRNVPATQGSCEGPVEGLWLVVQGKAYTARDQAGSVRSRFSLRAHALPEVGPEGTVGPGYPYGTRSSLHPYWSVYRCPKDVPESLREIRIRDG
jgi:hypothetical protein